VSERRVNATPPPAIAARDLVKTYGEVRAVRGVSFEVAAGEVFGLLGPNGAGRATTRDAPLRAGR